MLKDHNFDARQRAGDTGIELLMIVAALFISTGDMILTPLIFGLASTEYACVTKTKFRVHYKYLHSVHIHDCENISR